MCSNFETTDVEGVVVVSLNEHPPEFIIQKILDVENLPSPFVEKDCLKGYEWKVDTKYYSATVNVYSVQEKLEFDSEFCDKIRATVFYFNGREPSSFEDVLSWMPVLKNISSDIQLLICDSCEYDETCRKKLLNWCVENEFEFIELNPSEETDDEDDGMFSKSKGYGRIIEALQSHMWSNLVMKEDSAEENDSQKEKDPKNKSTSLCTSQKSADNIKKMTVNDEELLLEDQLLQKVFEGDDPNGESFEALFSKFASMKEKASNLSGEERKKYAEKVAIAFWKAMGGDDDEIAGLDDK